MTNPVLFCLAIMFRHECAGFRKDGVDVVMFVMLGHVLATNARVFASPQG